ncbi:methyl-accepting chemotaxis protein [Vibrio sp. FJH11]
MFFNKSLQKENQQLRLELLRLEQLQKSWDKEMLRLMLDPNGKITSVNDKFAQQLGFADKDILAKQISELVPIKARNTDHFRQMTRSITTKSFWNGAMQIIKGNGEEAWIRSVIQPNFDTNKKLTGFTFFGVELTRTIKNSREQEDMLNALNRSMAVIEFNLDGKVLKANDNFLITMGYSLDQIIGQHHRIFCEQDEASSQAYKEFWCRLSAGRFASERFKRLNRHGETVWLEASYNPIHNDRGELYKVVKFATDITEQVIQEQSMAQAAHLANDVSKETGTQTVLGQQVIGSTVENMKKLSQQMQQANEAIEELKAHSAKISELVKNISGIADQTNLLALNAAIEAARAGEHGKGFAVVADEVRQLSFRTNTTTHEIVSMVEENLKRTNSAVELIAQCQKDALNTLELSEQAGNVMNDIQDGASRVVDAVAHFNRTL